MAEETKPTPPPPPAQEPAKSTKNFGDFKLQTKAEVTISEGEGAPKMGVFLDIDTSRPIKSKADGRKYVRDSGLEGDFRVIQVKDTFTAKTENKVTFS